MHIKKTSINKVELVNTIEEQTIKLIKEIIRKAYLEYDSGNLQEAYDISAGGLNFEPNNAELLLLRGFILSMLTDHCDAGIADINKAMNSHFLDEQSRDQANWHLGRAYFYKNQDDKAEGYFSKIKNWSKLRKRSEINQHYHDFIINHKSHSISSSRTSDEKITSFWDNLIMSGEILYDHISKQIKSCNRPLSARYEKAISISDYFIDIYPLNLYSIACKSLEMVFLQDHLANFNSEAAIAEIAVGEGSFSSLVFQDLGLKLVGFDISPYSLRFAAQKPHVLGAIVSDAKNPPICPGCIDLIVSNNFLHHVSSKIDVLNHFAQISNYILFNENTYDWALAHPNSFEKDQNGFPNIAKYFAEMQCERDAQHLLSIPELNQIISRSGFRIIDCFSFLSRSSLFYSKLLGTPIYLPVEFRDFLANSEVLTKVKKLTKKLVEVLIVYDYYQDRSCDTFVSYYAQSTVWRISLDTKITLSCLESKGAINRQKNSVRCPHCNVVYPIKEGMIFMLPDGLKNIYDSFDEHAHIGEIHL